MSDGRCVGIDLGTTYSLAAYFDGHQPCLIPDAAGEFLMPSAVACLPDDRILIGWPAVDYRGRRPSAGCRGFKRWMGSDRSIELLGRPWTPIELSSLILSRLRENAEAFLGESVCEAVITVPAYFDANQREATRVAASLAGLRVARLLNEPTAAALAYGFLNLEHTRSLAVLDLGGGTFDVTVLRLHHGLSEVISSAGEAFLGGDDMTEELARWLAKRAGLADTLDIHPRLMKEAERAKHALSDEDTYTAMIVDGLDDPCQISVSRARLDELLEKRFQQIRRVVLRAFRDADFDPASCDGVLLAGGATRMPQIREMAREIFAQEPKTRLSPDTIIAKGAAVHAAMLDQEAAVEDLVFTDVCPWSLGVEVSKELGGYSRPGYFTPLISRNTTIPCSRARYFASVEDDQKSVEIRVFQGEGRYVKDCVSVGEVLLKGLPSSPKGLPIEVRFTYDLSGLLEVEALVQGMEPVREILIHRPEQLGSFPLEAARERLAKVRFYPLDEVAHLDLLSAGSQAVSEISPGVRPALEILLDRYEDALRGHDRRTFDQAHAQLKAFLIEHGLGERIDP